MWISLFLIYRRFVLFATPSSFYKYILNTNFRFNEELASFDDSELPESTLNLVEPYLKKSSFQAKNMLRKNNNAAAASLCNWVRGVCRWVDLGHYKVICENIPAHVAGACKKMLE